MTRLWYRGLNHKSDITAIHAAPPYGGLGYANPLRGFANRPTVITKGHKSSAVIVASYGLNNMSSDFLYRALRIVEIEKGVTLISKSQEAFIAHPRLGIDTRFPFMLGETEEHAVRQHQWQQKGYPTRGISTTPHLERAKYYAHENKIIVRINRSLLRENQIKEYVVNDLLGPFPQDIACPEDDEVILVQNQNSEWSKSIIDQVLRLDNDGIVRPF
jgi:hypothetical protein